MSEMLRDKRTTRGKRMTSLVGKAMEEDDAFWGDEDAWRALEEEGSDAESFCSQDADDRPDEFDSDFNDTESDGSSSDGEGGGSKKKKKVSAVSKKDDSTGKSSNVYKDPSGGKRPPQKSKPTAASTTAGSSAADISRKRRRDAQQSDTQLLLQSRQVRASTKARTEDTKAIADADARKNKHRKRRFRVNPKYEQEDLLREALETEELNARWLTAQRQQEYERAVADKPLKSDARNSGNFVRFLSRRGAPNTVTFSSDDALPAMFRTDYAATAAAAALQQSRRQPQICAITGLPAKYRDPLTGLPYANIAAFKEIRARSNSSSSHSGGISSVINEQ